MPLARFDAPFDHPDWIFEPKLDGFRAVAYVEGGGCRLVSRNRAYIARRLAGRTSSTAGEHGKRNKIFQPAGFTRLRDFPLRRRGPTGGT